MALAPARVHGRAMTGGRRADLPLKGRHPADVAELVDALDLGSSAARRAGSSPAVRTSPLSMVSEGWGRDWPRYSHGAYADEEAAARNASRGFWGQSCPVDLWGDRDYSG